MTTKPRASVEDVARDSAYRWFKLSEVDSSVRAGGADKGGTK